MVAEEALVALAVRVLLALEATGVSLVVWLAPVVDLVAEAPGASELAAALEAAVASEVALEEAKDLEVAAASELAVASEAVDLVEAEDMEVASEAVDLVEAALEVALEVLGALEDSPVEASMKCLSIRASCSLLMLK